MTSSVPSPARIRIGSAPDSWGVWFPDDPQQVPWERFLDEVSEAGYEWIELGPYGYLPTDPARLADETARRGSGRLGGHGLHRIAPRSGGLGPDLGACRAHRGTHPGDGRRAPGGHPVVLAGRQDGRGAGGPHTHPRAVARPDHPDGTAGPRGAGPLRAADRGPPARRHAHRQRGERQPLPRRHRPRAGLPLPGHRALRLLRRRQRRSSSRPTASGSAICTSSRSTRRCSPMSWRTRSRSVRPWHAA